MGGLIWQASLLFDLKLTLKNAPNCGFKFKGGLHYIRGQVDKRRIGYNISLKGIGTLTQMRRVTITDILFWVWNSSRYHILQFAMIFILVLHT